MRSKELWGSGQVPTANAFLLICADCDWSTPEYVWADIRPSPMDAVK